MIESVASDDAPYVEVVFALPDEQAIVPVPWATGMTARVAVERSNLAARFPQVVGEDVVFGIYGERVSRDHVLRPGDRVEICRPLVADPRRMRFDMMSGGRVMGGKEPRND